MGVRPRTNDKCSDIGPYDPAVFAPVTLLLQNAHGAVIDTSSRRRPIVFVGYIKRSKLPPLVLAISGHPLERRVRR